MLSVAEALQIVLKNAEALPPVRHALDESAVGRVLAEDIVADLDMPPFDKAMMDGFAVRSVDLAQPGAGLQMIEEVMAGQTPQKPVGAGQTTRIMTGAPIPAGADAVVTVERTKTNEAGQVFVDDQPRPGQHILTRGREMRTGDIIVRAGATLRPQEFGLLSAAGRALALVHPAPRVALVPTGDEIVPATERPGPGQIRNSNGPMLLAQVVRAGGVPNFLGIARDQPQSLRSLISAGLEADVLLLSGGVSAGKLDLVPGVLAELGVEAMFHKVEMKPGKPLLFGVHGGQGKRTLVFGLPGNPVSSLACFELFVRPALCKLAGHANPGPDWCEAELTGDYVYKTDRPTYHPANVSRRGTELTFRVAPWIGSADLRALVDANALVLFPAGNHQHRAGQRFPVLMLE